MILQKFMDRIQVKKCSNGKKVGFSTKVYLLGNLALKEVSMTEKESILISIFSVLV